jgi:hypothetical protein
VIYDSCYASYPMARALRIEFPGAVYHVTSLGTARQDIVVTTAIGRKGVSFSPRSSTVLACSAMPIA